MTQPKALSSWKLLQRISVPNVYIYEEWKQGIDIVHHVHLPSGITINFYHEASEGHISIQYPERPSCPTPNR